MLICAESYRIVSVSNVFTVVANIVDSWYKPKNLTEMVG